MIQPDTRLLLTVEQAAERLDIGRTLAYAIISAGENESVQIGRLMPGRAPNGASSIYQGKDGLVARSYGITAPFWAAFAVMVVFTVAVWRLFGRPVTAAAATPAAAAGPA